MADNKDRLPTQAEIAARAYEIYVERGREDGHALQDWLFAEEELKQLRTNKSTTPKSKVAAAGQSGGATSVDE